MPVRSIWWRFSRARYARYAIAPIIRGLVTGAADVERRHSDDPIIITWRHFAGNRRQQRHRQYDNDMACEQSRAHGLSGNLAFAS